ncbi:CpaF family protein [Fodinicola acaciae]|uniref:CpaF family protein n=1 Tax=Fodinicola acaciae TaxID=2681555 RepID=UPI0013D7693A|nr:ATPase, T2SS/T4P/T4SS family [Fodinicola acaciae]
MSSVTRQNLVTELLRDACDVEARHAINDGQSPMTPAEEAAACTAVRDRLCGLGGFEQHMANPRVEDIYANGFDNVWLRFTDGTTAQAPPVADSDEDLITLIRDAAARAGRDGGEERRWDPSAPQLRLQLPGGQRLQAIAWVARRPSVAIRCFRALNCTLDELHAWDTIDARLHSLLTAAVRAKRNILISGGQGAGKTTMLRALLSLVPPGERLGSVEDVFEIDVDLTGTHRNSLAFQARDPTVEGVGEVDVATLTQWGLRMRIDRLIVGEVRGLEVVAMLLAMSQGWDGSIGTIHARTSEDALVRLIAYAYNRDERTIAMLASAAAPLVVHIAFRRDRPGQRVVSSVREVTGVDETGRRIQSTELFAPSADRRALPAYPPSPQLLDELVDAGLDARLVGWGG